MRMKGMSKLFVQNFRWLSQIVKTAIFQTALLESGFNHSLITSELNLKCNL